jgi:peptidoglycan/LPS O-acetylase OafA/YrhL
MLFLHNLVPDYHESIVWAGWTLGVEMLFYAMFPLLLVTIIDLRRGAVIFGLSVLASMAARELLQLKDQGAYASMSFVVNAPYFFAGILAFYIYQKLTAYHLQRAYVGPLCSLAFAVALWLLVFTPIRDALAGDYIGSISSRGRVYLGLRAYGRRFARAGFWLWDRCSTAASAATASISSTP